MEEQLTYLPSELHTNALHFESLVELGSSKLQQSTDGLGVMCTTCDPHVWTHKKFNVSQSEESTLYTLQAYTILLSYFMPGSCLINVSTRIHIFHSSNKRAEFSFCPQTYCYTSDSQIIDFDSSEGRDMHEVKHTPDVASLRPPLCYSTRLTIWCLQQAVMPRAGACSNNNLHQSSQSALDPVPVCADSWYPAVCARTAGTFPLPPGTTSWQQSIYETLTSLYMPVKTITWPSWICWIYFTSSQTTLQWPTLILFSHLQLTFLVVLAL